MLYSLSAIIFSQPSSLPIGGLSLDFKGSSLLILALAVMSMAWAFLAYRRTTPPASLGLRLFLGGLRATALLLVIFLIFEPALSLRRQVRLKPLLTVVFDDTQSMRNRDATGERSLKLAELMGDPTWNSLRERFEIRAFAAGDSLRDIAAVRYDSMKLATVGTDLAQAWERAVSDLDSAELSALVLVSDGGDNAGKDPRESAGASPIPIFTVGIGDTAAIRDASVASWVADPLLYKGKETTLVVRLKAQGMEGTAATLQLTAADERIIAQRDLRLPPDALETEVRLPFLPDRVGEIPYHLNLRAAEDERSLENNSRALFVNVKESRIRVLMVGGLPSFESMILQKAIIGLPDCELIPFSFSAEAPNWDRIANDLSSAVARADALILINLPPPQKAAPLREALKRALANHPLPLWAWVSSQSQAAYLQELLGAAFLFRPAGSIGEAPAIPLEYYAELDPDAELAESDFWRDLPPLVPPDFILEPTGSQRTLLVFQSIESGASLGPALMVWESGGRRFAINLGSGFWRWSFLSVGTGGSDELYLNHIMRLLRWLSMAAGSKSLQLKPDRNLYSAGDRIHFDARVLGGDGRPVASAQVEVSLQGPALAKIMLAGDAQGRYQGDFAPEALGSYSYQGLAMMGSDTLGADSGNFVVEAYNIEKETLIQNRPLLEAIAKASGGTYLLADSLSNLVPALPSVPRIRSVGWSRRFFLNWDIWGFVIGLLALEWIIRKRRGML
jgi:hypothetical protein